MALALPRNKDISAPRPNNAPTDTQLHVIVVNIVYDYENHWVVKFADVCLVTRCNEATVDRKCVLTSENRGGGGLS